LLTHLTRGTGTGVRMDYEVSKIKMLKY
jgi:hypothetical protein